MPLFDRGVSVREIQATSTFAENLSLPVHRWFRYSAGFSARWARKIIGERAQRRETCVLDPFCGSGTTLVCAEDESVESYGVESHPFIARVAQAKLARRTDPGAYRDFARDMLSCARRQSPSIETYPVLIRKCFQDPVLADLDRLRRAHEKLNDGSAASELAWLTLAAILRTTSHVGTAQWQYVLPRKTKQNPAAPFPAFDECASRIYTDMVKSRKVTGPSAKLVQSDARTCLGIPDASATLVLTSPPYPNNYDYADATRLEMSFFGEVRGWGDLQDAVRQHLVRSCSQHVTEKTIRLDETIEQPALNPIRHELSAICAKLADIRNSKGGRKTYHLMVACYFLDLAHVWLALRRVCADGCEVCFVIGDSAPYGIYVPVMKWMSALAEAAGFGGARFEKTRNRNIKWKNRKHRVPLCEGLFWVEG
jgi:hypothetical protein